MLLVFDILHPSWLCSSTWNKHQMVICIRIRGLVLILESSWPFPSPKVRKGILSWNDFPSFKKQLSDFLKTVPSFCLTVCQARPQYSSHGKSTLYIFSLVMGKHEIFSPVPGKHISQDKGEPPKPRAHWPIDTPFPHSVALPLTTLRVGSPTGWTRFLSPVSAVRWWSHQKGSLVRIKCECTDAEAGQSRACWQFVRWVSLQVWLSHSVVR